MPPHLHERRMEAYLYFDLAPEDRVIHLMGRPDETRHLIVADGDAVLSPAWSIHMGAGTGPYAFVWGMTGENQEYNDVAPVPVAELQMNTACESTAHADARPLRAGGADRLLAARRDRRGALRRCRTSR